MPQLTLGHLNKERRKHGLNSTSLFKTTRKLSKLMRKSLGIQRERNLLLRMAPQSQKMLLRLSSKRDKRPIGRLSKIELKTTMTFLTKTIDKTVSVVLLRIAQLQSMPMG